MDIPQDAFGGKLIAHPNGHSWSREEVWTFIITKREEAMIYITWDKPCYYSVTDGIDCMPGTNTCQGVITKRKNGKWMFKGHQRLYSRQEVLFQCD